MEKVIKKQGMKIGGELINELNFANYIAFCAE